MKSNNLVPIILAGGMGGRLWPLSKASYPKQFLSFDGRKPIFVETIKRADKLSTIPPLIFTNRSCLTLTKKLIGKRNSKIFIETYRKNTAAPIALAASWVLNKFGNAPMLIMPSDHIISPEDEFYKAALEAEKIVHDQDCIVLFGIPPKRPETSYGYIKCIANTVNDDDVTISKKVKYFIEKPSLLRAARYIRSNKFFWNSGIFLSKACTILELFKLNMPEVYNSLNILSKSGYSISNINEYFKNVNYQSFDYGIVEKSKNLVMVSCNFHWEDIGNWTAVERLFNPNNLKTVHVGENIYDCESKDCFVLNNTNKVIALIGLNEIVLVNTEDALFAISKKYLPDMKKYLGSLKSIPKKLFS